MVGTQFRGRRADPDHHGHPRTPQRDHGGDVSHISDPVFKEQYEKVIAAGGRLAGPAAEALLANRLDQDTLDWLKTSFFKTELELGHCLRTPAEGPCECDRWRAGGLIALLIGIAASTWITTTAPQVAGSPQERRRASSS